MQPVVNAVAKYFSDILHEAPAKNSGQIIRIANLIQKHAKVSEYVKHLGHGGYGFAFQVDNQWVLKLTSDLNEVHASFAVGQAGHLPNVVDIAYAGIALGGMVAVGVVVLEYVPEVFSSAFPVQALELSDNVQSIKDLHGVWPSQVLTLRPAEARRRLNKAQRDLIEILGVQNDDYLDQVADGLSQLRQLGVYYIDCHPNNVGVIPLGDDEALVKLFDLGFSSPPPGLQAPTIEEVAVAGLGEPSICKRQRIPVVS
jgi:hypothetical protein